MERLDAAHTLEVLRARTTRIDRLVLDVVGRVTDAQVTEPSLLPGWTRGHVLAHIAGAGAAAARQVEVAVAGGDLLDYYDGGMAGRNGAIEALAGDSASEHIARVTKTVRRIEAAADSVTPGNAVQRGENRDGIEEDSVDGDWRTLIEADRDLLRLIGRQLRRCREHE